MAELKRDVLAQISSPDVRVYIIWVPIMADDSATSASAAVAQLSDPRARHFWDEGGVLSRAIGGRLGLPAIGGDTGVAWDVYLLYPPGVRWSDADSVPLPAFWMHQLMGVDPRTAAFFDGPEFAKQVRAVLPR